MDTAQKIAQLLLEKQAVKISVDPPFTWTSGIHSPIYCDNRVLISYPEARKLVLEGFKMLMKNHDLQCDVLGGTATAAIPWAAFLAHELGMPMVYIRPKPKGHGAGKQVEGTMKQGSRVLIVEDLFSTGGSSIRSAEACQREYDAKVVGAVAIFSHQLKKGVDAFSEAGIPYFSLSNLTTLVNELDMPEDQKKLIIQFKDDPEAWWDTFNQSS